MNPKGSIVNGVVSEVTPRSVRVDLGDDVEGTIRVSEISRDRVEDAGNVFSVGDEVQAKFMAVDRKSHCINLSIKAKDNEEERRVMKEYSTESSGGTSLGDIFKELGH
jgi:small subunit ribosomal protein S1